MRNWSLLCRLSQYGMRPLFGFMLVLAVAFVVWTNRARRQQQAVDAIHAMGGRTYYDFQVTPPRIKLAMDGPTFEIDDCAQPSIPHILRQLLGDDYFCRITIVEFNGVDLQGQDLTALSNLHGLERVVFYGGRVDEKGMNTIAALPEHVSFEPHMMGFAETLDANE